MKTFIELKDICKTYKMGESIIHANKNINIQIQKGELVAIIGKSGSEIGRAHV